MLRPGFLTIAGGYVVVVDESQPVVASYSFDGELVDLVGWSDLAVAPSAFVFPRRWFVDIGEGVLVGEATDTTPVVAITTSGEGTLTVELYRGAPPSRGLYRRRLWTTPPSGRSHGNWTFETSITEGYRFAAHVSCAHPGGDRAGASFAEPSSILHQRVDGSRAVVCVQHVNKRPWSFAPSRTLRVLTDNGSDRLDEHELVLPEIAELCFRLEPSPEQFRARLAEYMHFSIGELDQLNNTASAARVTLSGSSTQTRIATCFELAETPGVRYCRIDEPFDEFGNLAGLQGWNVLLDEDIASGVPQRLAQRSDGGIVYV